MDSWVLQPVINPIAATIAIVVVTLLLIVGPSFANVTVRRRISLTLIRLGVIAMAALALFRPGCVQKVEKNQSAVLLFLLDVSRSMELPHQKDNSSRWGALKDAIESNQAKLDQLRELKVDVRFFAFDNQVVPLDIIEGKVQLPEKPLGSETDIGTAIYRKSQDIRDQRVVGMVVASDGGQNADDPEIELSQATDTLRDMEIPLYTMAFGMPANSSQVADIAITNLPEQHRVVVKNRLNVKATLIARGFTNRSVVAQLIIVNRQGVETVVDSVTVQPTRPYEEILVVFKNFVPSETGEFQMKVRAVRQPEEVAFRNNELPSFLSVSDGGLRVLFLDGNLRYEQTYLLDALSNAAQGIDVDIRRIHPNTYKSWPISGLAELFEDPTYDVFIIGDLHADALYDAETQTRNLDALVKAVENGKGLLLLGGQNSFGPGNYFGTPLADIMPILMDRSEGKSFGPNVELKKDLHINKPIGLKPVGERHFVTNLGQGDNNVADWKKLWKLAGANRFHGLKDNALVLLESDDAIKSPILVAGFLGGRVLAFAGDTTWRWFTHGEEDAYNQFWRQVIFWLAFWDGKNDDMVWLLLPQRRYSPMANIRFTTGARTLTGEEITGASYQAKLTSPGGATSDVLIRQSTEENWATLDRDLVTAPGLYSIEVTAKKDGKELGSTRREFVVFDRDKEKANPAADPEQMARLANQTKEVGGKSIMPDELGDLLDDIIANPKEMKIEIPTKWQLGETFADSAGFLGLFVALLGVEWWLRKKWGLV